jgi:hypothetical protein
MSSRVGDVRRARRWFWALVGVAVLAMSGLYTAWAARPGQGTGLVVLGSGLILTAATVQAARILLVLQNTVSRRPLAR